MRSNIMALQQREADLKKSARNILAVAEKDNRELSREEDENYSKIVKALEANGRELATETARLAAENSGEAMPDENVAFAMLARGEVPPENPFAKNDKGRVGKCKYSDLFGTPAKSAFRSFGEFARAVAHSHQLFDPRLKMAGTESSPSDAGFLVAPEQAAQIWDQLLSEEVVRPRAQLYPMASETRKIVAVQDDDHSGNILFSGMAAGWSVELETLDTADMKVRLLQLSANKFGLLNNASNELLEDSSYESILSAKFQAGAAWHIDNALLFGDGAGKPRGALSDHNALVIVNKETDQPAGTFVYENACAMYAAMPSTCLNRAIWLFSSSLVPQLLKMQLVVKSVDGLTNIGGSATPVLNVAPDGSMTLLTRPVIVTEKLSVPGDQGDAAFVDFTQYAVGMRREIRLEKSNSAGWLNDSTWFRLTCRLDGQPLWARPQKLKNSQTVSPFVTLQAR